RAKCCGPGVSRRAICRALRGAGRCVGRGGALGCARGRGRGRIMAIRDDRAAGRVTLWAVEVFVALAEEGAISAVARRLGVSASGVSRQVAALEGAMGGELVGRSARPMALTQAGQAFLPHAGAMLDELARGRATVGLADPAGLSSFRLGMIEDFEAEVTPLLLGGMGQDLRACRFLLETGPSHRLHAQLEARALDMIVAAH